MCDYSLHGVASRPAKIGDKLVTSRFPQTLTRGFTAVGEPDIAVCLLPGTELAFESEVQQHFTWLQTLFFKKERWTIPHRLARFRQIDMDNPTTHHDALEFPDGRVVLLTKLRPGQRAVVLQLPVETGHASKAPERHREERSGEAIRGLRAGGAGLRRLARNDSP